MKNSILVLLFCFISLQASESTFEWVYSSDKSCSAYLEKSNTKDREISWTGDCTNKKINGYGILLLTGIKDSKREKLINYKGLAHNGILDGDVFVQFYNKYKTKASMVIENDNPKPNSVAYYIYPDYNIIEKEFFSSPDSQKQSIEKSKNPEEYNKMEKLVYKHDDIFKKSLSTCEKEVHDFKLSFYENKVDGSPSYSSVVSDIRDLFKCQMQYKQYKNIVDTANDFLSKTDDEEKKQFYGRLAEIVGIGYYYLRDYKKSFDYFSKAKDFSYFKESKTILESSYIQTIAKEKANTIINQIISNEVTNSAFLLSFAKNTESMKQIIKDTKQKIDINSKDQNGETILTKLASKDNLIQMQLLIESGADISYKHEKVFGPLIKNVLQNDNNPRTVQKLISMGLNIKLIENNDSGGLLYYAIMDKTYEQWSDNLYRALDKMITVLEKAKNKQQISIENVKNDSSASGDTNKKYEARFPSLETVKILVKNGAKFNTFEIIKNSLDPNKTKDKSVFKFLIASGANVNIRENGSCLKTPLLSFSHGQIGLEKEYTENIQLLLKNGADVNAKESDACGGNTSLHNAIYNPENVKTILQYNPNLYIKNAKGKTALALCEEENNGGLFSDNIGKSCKIIKGAMKK